MGLELRCRHIDHPRHPELVAGGLDPLPRLLFESTGIASAIVPRHAANIAGAAMGADSKADLGADLAILIPTQYLHGTAETAQA